MEIIEKFELAADQVKYEKPNTVATSLGSEKDTPYYLHVSSDTDLSVVMPSIAGVVVTLLIGVVTILFQRRQIRANITGFRHQWMVELRGCAAEYMQYLFSVAWSLTEKEGYAESGEYFAAQEKIALLTFRIELLLSRDDPSTKAIFSLDRALCDKLYALSYKESWDDFIIDLYKLRDLFRVELEDAWLDVQVDLSAKTRQEGKSEIFKRLALLAKKSTKESA
ncbi:hypothetical protein [Pseudomonas sp. W2Aug9]|uniref:hypothetical protein n=1 Tax=Pseudomonas sp. W2Aug9 TaxID=1215242 RepID=UPI0020057966|nr:hypothetical protein [Pseudomonas sp. W2Aug9]MCK3826212.1 hypothetical protein [Pseudomonas sp. W2Aug9]